MSSTTAITRQNRDGSLWALALALSLATNLLIALLAGIVLQEFSRTVEKPETRPAETATIILPSLLEPGENPAPAPASEPAPVPPARTPFARTSADQEEGRPDAPTHIGERDTLATSDAVPDPTAPPLPAQAGVEPLHEGHIETTESRYQDGEPADPTPAAADGSLAARPPAAAAESRAARGSETSRAGSAENEIPPTPPEKLATSSLPVDVPVPRPEPDAEPAEPRKAPPELPREGIAEAETETDQPTPDQIKETQETATAEAARPDKPVFHGNQRRTVLRGSISRSGRSALAVENTALGRYQAQISRAIELEWQRNCVRYADFITPGFITVRFSVDAKGKIGRRDFVGAIQAGEHQKGFTLDAIRDARIPAMPAELARDFSDEPLELIFNFYF